MSTTTAAPAALAASNPDTLNRLVGKMINDTRFRRATETPVNLILEARP